MRNNFRFNAMWHTRSVVVLVLCRVLAESDVTFTSVTDVDYVSGIITRLM